MRHRWIVVVACVRDARLAASRSPSAAPKGFLPGQRRGRFEVNVRAPEGTSLDETRSSAERIAREIRDDPERRR